MQFDSMHQSLQMSAASMYWPATALGTKGSYVLRSMLTAAVMLQVDVYQDEDSSRKDDIASMKVDQGDFKVFYDRVKDLKDYYRNRPIEVTEVIQVHTV